MKPKSCLLINGDPEDQKVFMNALVEVAPQTLLVLADDVGEA